MTAPVSVDLKALSKLAQEAAQIHPGPWKVDPENGTDVLATSMGGLDDVIMAEFGGKPFHSATPEFAALFAACSPDVVLSLVSRVHKAEEQVAAMVQLTESLAEVIRTHLRLIQNRAEARQ